VERHRAPSLLGERRRRATPRVARLATPVHEQHRPVVGIAIDVGHEVDALEPFEARQGRLWGHARILPHCLARSPSTSELFIVSLLPWPLARATYPPAPEKSSVPSPGVAEYTEVRVGTKFLKAARWAADRHVEYAGDLPGIPTVAQVLGL